MEGTPVASGVDRVGTTSVVVGREMAGIDGASVGAGTVELSAVIVGPPSVMVGMVTASDVGKVGVVSLALGSGSMLEIDGASVDNETVEISPLSAGPT